MIRLNDNDSATLATIAQYQQLPVQRKQALVGRLSDQARPIGLILIGDEPENPTEEVLEIAKDFREWTQRNRKSRSSLRTVPAAKAEAVLVGAH